VSGGGREEREQALVALADRLVDDALMLTLSVRLYVFDF